MLSLPLYVQWGAGILIRNLSSFWEENSKILLAPTLSAKLVAQELSGKGELV